MEPPIATRIMIVLRWILVTLPDVGAPVGDPEGGGVEVVIVMASTPVWAREFEVGVLDWVEDGVEEEEEGVGVTDEEETDEEADGVLEAEVFEADPPPKMVFTMGTNGEAEAEVA